MFGIEEWNAGTTTGVPQLLCPAEPVAHWEGINVPSSGRIVESDFRSSGNLKDPATDYDLACSIAMLPQEAGLITVGQGKALVVCGEIPFAAWLPANSFLGGYILVPEFWTKTEADCQAILLGIEDAAYSNTGLALTSTGLGFMLFAATDCSTDSDFENIHADCPAGIYGVATHVYDAPDFQLRIIRLEQLLE
ncbi:hypothetical protein [Hymenobacter wooponensis]|uniref:Uncharacterized protein n=1 Tax=Hymenobacter wooponensis TaxID=1525360 RepID=A0A4Z0MJL4_9BACT|nr:hypothetical protein [Hymenobacter wooponensis]TGD79696.1 hypothetical protein EU557_15890 [Hymenobacter wooponensis]